MWSSEFCLQAQNPFHMICWLCSFMQQQILLVTFAVKVNIWLRLSLLPIRTLPAGLFFPACAVVVASPSQGQD